MNLEAFPGFDQGILKGRPLFALGTCWERNPFWNDHPFTLEMIQNSPALLLDGW